MSCLCGWTETCEHCWPPAPVEPIPLEDYGKSVKFKREELINKPLKDLLERLLKKI